MIQWLMINTILTRNGEALNEVNALKKDILAFAGMTNKTNTKIHTCPHKFTHVWKNIYSRMKIKLLT
jgi:hypothetical protein